MMQPLLDNPGPIAPMHPAPGGRRKARTSSPGTVAGTAHGSRDEQAGPDEGASERPAPSPSRATPADVDDAAARIAKTTRFWRAWLGRARIPDHRYRDPIQRSALAIKGLTYMPTGATVAALTTSLPETPGGERNWDYRYTWMRDTTFTLQALHWLKLDWEADEFMQFVADVEATEDGSLQIMYGIDGRRDLTESTLDELSGYAGARPVRIGNGAFDQRQNDVFGAVLDSILLHTRESNRLPQPPLADRRDAGRVRHEGVAEHRPGHLGGPWRAAALRVLEAHVLGCARPGGEAGGDPGRPGATDVVGGDRGGDPGRHPRARRRRRGVLRQHYATDALDASVLLAAIFGFLRATTSASTPPSTRSPTSSPRTASSCATTRTRPTTGSPARKGPSSSARSGSCPRSPSSARCSAPAT